jgi:hypothetical protein
MIKIDPKHPGQSTAGDDFCDPHGHAGGPGAGPHAGLGRSDDGTFNNSSFSLGGRSPDGEDMVAKYRPKGRSSSSDEIPEGYELNEDGTDYA